MGSLTLAYPSIAGKTTQEQLESMRRYLCSVTEQLNLADWSAKATLTEISQAIDADSLSEAEKKTTLSGYGALKALIIKTADFAAAREFVDARKQQRLRTTALVYLSQHETNLQPRFDVIEIYAPNGTATKKPQINHMEDAF